MLEFDVVNDALEEASAEVGAAEAHGLLCGILCAESQQAGTRWLNELLPDADSVSEELRAMLGTAFAETLKSLEGDQMDFVLILPDDDESINVRAEALGQWGQGLLYGLGVGGLAELDEHLPENVREIIRDFEQIGRAGGGDGDSEEEEVAFAELLEFTRVGVQLIYEELVGLRSGESQPVRH